MNDPNLTLLTQEEIDTLVQFLAENKKNIRNEVLNQNSIDKLINLIQNNDARRFRLDAITVEDERAKRDLLIKAGVCENEEQVCCLYVRCTGENSYLELYARNAETGKEVKITPANYENQHLNESDTEWGCAIIPAMFDGIADAFGLKYERKTLEMICSIYAERIYGDKGRTLPLVYLPSSAQLLKNLIK